MATVVAQRKPLGDVAEVAVFRATKTPSGDLERIRIGTHCRRRRRDEEEKR